MLAAGDGAFAGVATNPDDSPAAAYYKGLQDAGWQLHAAAARFGNDIDAHLIEGRDVERAIEALRDIWSLSARASNATQTYGQVFTG